MDEYETKTLRAIRRWQTEPPPPVARWFGKAAGPATEAVQNMIPTSALRGALLAVQTTAGRLNGHTALLKQARVSRVEELRDVELKFCDELAAGVRRRAMAMAGSSGALLGIAGAAGMVADVPTLMVLAFRSIQRIGLCYGETLDNEEARRMGLAIFALASANSVEEKAAALDVLSRPFADATDAAWRDGVERAAERELAKEAAVLSINNLAMQAGKHLGWRKAAGSLPVFGALVGGSVNAWYLYDLCNVARYCFQERWLKQRYGERRLMKALAPPPRRKAVAATG